MPKFDLRYNGNESLSFCLARVLESMQYNTITEQPHRVTRTYRAALYIRLSHEDGNNTESDSVVNQKNLLTNFARAHPDIESFWHYVDNSYSGANFNCPDFVRMISDVYVSKVDCVIVKSSLRFDRNVNESSCCNLEFVAPLLNMRLH